MEERKACVHSFVVHGAMAIGGHLVGGRSSIRVTFEGIMDKVSFEHADSGTEGTYRRPRSAFKS